MAEVEFYDYDVELHTKYRPKGITNPKEAFAFMEKLVPNSRNAFLFRGNIKTKNMSEEKGNGRTKDDRLSK